MPGQVEEIAEGTGIPLKELFSARVAVDRVETVEFGAVLVLMPAIVGAAPGAILPPNQFGACIFLEGGKCQIHERGKPYECAMATHTGGASPAEMVIAWLPYQSQIAELVAR